LDRQAQFGAFGRPIGRSLTSYREIHISFMLGQAVRLNLRFDRAACNYPSQVH
jgi:hypothetical protein